MPAVCLVGPFFFLHPHPSKQSLVFFLFEKYFSHDQSDQKPEVVFEIANVKPLD